MKAGNLQRGASSSLISLSQALPFVSSYLCPSASYVQTPPLASSSSFLCAHGCLLYMLTSSCANSLTKLPFFSETLPTAFSSILFRACPSKIKSSEYLEATFLVSYIPQTRAEPWAIVKDFLEVTKDSHRSSEEGNIVIQMYQSHFSELFSSAHLLSCVRLYATP